MMVNWTKTAEQSWAMEREGITVRTTFKTHWKDILNQIFTEEIVLEVKDHEQKMRLESKEDLKLVFPQEFKALIRLNGRFDFLGWWEGTESTWWLDKPLEKSETPGNINMVLLRRT
jgi:hypothetical protein